MADETNPVAPTKQTTNYKFAQIQTYVGYALVAIGGAVEALAQQYPNLHWLGIVTMIVGGINSAWNSSTFLKVNAARQIAMIQANSPPMQPVIPVVPVPAPIAPPANPTPQQ